MAEIYMITNKVNGKSYIGKTEKTVNDRFVKHCDSALYGSETFLHRAIRKNGPDAFLVETLEECQNPDERERYWIIHYGTKMPFGYNMTDGGEGGKTHHLDSWKEGMRNRQSMSGKNNPMYGKSAMKGKKHSDETKKKMSEKRKAFWNDTDKRNKVKVLIGEDNPMYGKTPSNAVIVYIDGVTYPSIKQASLKLKRSEKWIRMHNERTLSIR